MELRPASPSDAAAISRLLDAVGRDGTEALSEYKRIRVLEAGAVCEMVAAANDAIVAYAQAAWHHEGPGGDDGHWGIELASTAAGDVSADVVRLLTSRLSTPRAWVMWARRPIDEEVAGRLGLAATRSLHRVAVSLPVVPPPAVAGVVIRPFRPGRDEDAWIAANNAAFAGHPENGAVDREELARRMEQPWFDGPGLRMAWDGDRLVGSCWTKVHPGGDGEIYIIGVHPDHQGRGLGRTLVLEGLRYLAEERDCRLGTLWVDAANKEAMTLYESIGFRTVQTIRQYEERPDATG